MENVGTGFVTGCRRSLLARDTTPHVVCDEAEYFSVAFQHHAHGVILVQTVHVSPHSTYKAPREVLQDLTTLRSRLRPHVTALGGDFNMSRRSPREPLSAACRACGCLAAYQAAFPEATLTNYTSSCGKVSHTDIDHVFIHGAVPITQSVLLPAISSHAHMLVDVCPPLQTKDITSWKFLKWRRVPQSCMEALMRPLTWCGAGAMCIL